MRRLVVFGPTKLEGEVSISGAKNSVLPIMAATLLTDEKCLIENVPYLRDVSTMKRLLEYLDKEVIFEDHTLIIKPRLRKKRRLKAPYELVSTMRASFCVLGPLLARFKRAKVSLPGGCVIGVRPVDLHLKGLRELGARFRISSGYIEARAKSLRGSKIYLAGRFGPSVLATANLLMASVLSKGETLIENAACEPEVKDLAIFLKKMGAEIEGEGTPWIKVRGVKYLGRAEHRVIPDRIEAGTFIIAALVSGGRISIRDARPQHLGAVIDKLRETGADIKMKEESIEIGSKGCLKAKNMTTHPYPGFPTDLQAQYMSLMSVSKGTCVIKEEVFPDRFMHVQELNRMGALIRREGPYAIIEGEKELYGAEVMASDLRASAALVLAGLKAKGKTVIQRVYHLERGYEDLDKKLRGLGAKIRILR